MLYRENYTTSKQKISIPKSFQQFLTWEKTTRDTIDFKKTYVDMADDLIAGLMLSQIVFWHLPNKDGNTKLRVQKDGKQWLAKKYDDWYDEIRTSFEQARRAIRSLENLGLIERKVKEEHRGKQFFFDFSLYKCYNRYNNYKKIEDNKMKLKQYQNIDGPIDRLTVAVPKPLADRVRENAEEQNITVSGLLSKLIHEYYEKQQKSHERSDS